MGWLIVIGTIPIVVLGYLGSDIIENNLRSLWLIATTLIVFGVILGLADTYGKRERTLDQLSNRDGLLYGAAQALALMPGVSRSGATIAMGRLLGYKREAALRYSFLLALAVSINCKVRCHRLIVQMSSHLPKPLPPLQLPLLSATWLSLGC
jgi:undecaprenyl-diphosphatase